MASNEQHKGHFYFDTDSVALKNNADYQSLLKTLAILEAQKCQAIKDLESLYSLQNDIDSDPCAVLKALKDGELGTRLPHRQELAQLPTIDWDQYKEGLESLAHCQSTYNTRKKVLPTLATAAKKKREESGKSTGTFGQQWSTEEQSRLEQLLDIYPPEEKESRRWQKIANALGNRTPRQVCCRVQKYFIKLAKAGLPVPGRMPNLSTYTKKRKSKRIIRPSTFFHSLQPRVFMTSSNQTTGEMEDGEDEEDEVDEEDVLSDNEGSCVADGSHTSQCCSCCGNILMLTHWVCAECTSPAIALCSVCINSNWQNEFHLSSHELVPAEQRKTFIDTDYTANSEYSYLDPNFLPAAHVSCS